MLQDGEVRRVGENMPRRVDARIVAATNRRLDEEVAANRFRADLRFRLDVVRIVVPPLRERASDIPALAAHFWTEAAAARRDVRDADGRDALGARALRLARATFASSRTSSPRSRSTPHAAAASVPRCCPSTSRRGAATGATTFEAARHEFERRFVRAALAHAGGQRARAARTLGVSRQGLAKMMRRLRIHEEVG